MNGDDSKENKSADDAQSVGQATTHVLEDLKQAPHLKPVHTANYGRKKPAKK